MTIWNLILFSAVTAFVFRVIPFFMKNNKLLVDQQGSFYRFLSYSTQAMLGMIIYDTAFNQKNLLQFFSSFNSLDAIKIILLLAMFILVIKTNKVLLYFLISLLVYFVALLISNF